ncbi:olfactory receptor 14A16-like [Tiliqua scincoides]|uniref:olfactory receptor 14A16-like n=1 Tax=Tiliqua scincoides TaxID=71010 RepID=UPI0034622354
MANQSTATEFLLMGFSDERDMQIFHVVMFLSIYLITLLGNFLLITAVILNHNLHSPMYFFLVNLSFSDICYISTTVPKSMATSLTNNKLISFSGCVTQVFLVVVLASGELFILTVMAYDRYIAICHPLQYTLIMNWNTCLQMAAASWVFGVINSVVNTTNTFKLLFCRSNTIQQFFCDIPQLLLLSCSDTKANKWVLFAVVVFGSLFCFSCVLFSYGYIFSTVLKIPSVQARYKAFSTCMPHLAVFSLFLSTAIFSYLRPRALSAPAVDLLAAILYTVLPPLMNPIIYSLRNKEIQMTLMRMSKNCISCSHWMRFSKGV